MNLRNCFLLLLAASVTAGTLMPVHAHPTVDPCLEPSHRCGEEPTGGEGLSLNHDCHRCPTCSGVMMHFVFQSEVVIERTFSDRIALAHHDPAVDVLIDAPPRPPRA